MVIFLTGATGLAGAAIAEAAARRGYRVIGTGYRSEQRPAGLAEFVQADLSDEHTATRLVLDHFPDIIINAAAVSEPARCDADPQGSAKVNIHLPATLARLAHHVSSRLIHLSTDMVFDGRSSRYSPSASPNPASEYGRQKLEAEIAVTKQAAPFATVVRTTLLMGNSLGGRRSVHEKLFELWAHGEKPRLFEDELRQPCLADNLADAVVEISERNDLRGLFHWAGAEEISRYELGRRIRTHFKLPEDLIEKTSLGSDPRFANRPRNLSLDISGLAGKLKTRPLPFDAQLERLKVPPPFRAWYNRL